MEPGPSAERTADQEPAQQNLVEYSATQIRTILSTMNATPAQLQQVAAMLQLGPTEVAALAAGRSGLQMTPEQHARLVAMAARSSAEDAEGAQDNEGCGDVCGSCGSPTPSSSGPRTPAVTGTHTQIDEHGAGTTGHTGSVGGGTVRLRYGVDSEWSNGTRRANRFAISYQGPDSQNAHWLQFIWREIIGIHADNSAHPLTGTITTTGGSYQLTGGGTETTSGTPAKANYNTDTASSTDPFYEAAGKNNRTADATTIYDLPGAATPYINQAFAAGATRVVSRAHFITFLVQGDVVTYKVGINIIWTQASAAAAPAQSETVGDCGAASSLSPTALRERFHEQFPSFNYIR